MMVVGLRLFKIMEYLSRMWFLVVFVSYLRVIILVYFCSNACLYELNLGDTEVLFVMIVRTYYVRTITVWPNYGQTECKYRPM